MYQTGASQINTSKRKLVLTSWSALGTTPDLKAVAVRKPSPLDPPQPTVNYLSLGWLRNGWQQIRKTN